MERSLKTGSSFLLATAVMAGLCGTAWALILNVQVSSVLSISDDTGNITLTFSNFRKGTESSTATVTYHLRANNMAPGMISAAVIAELSSPFDLADLQAIVSDYTNLGDSNLSHLGKIRPDYVTIGTSPTPLADKHPGQGNGDVLLNGNLAITWRARLTQDASAGSETRSLLVTLKDGN